MLRTTPACLLAFLLLPLAQPAGAQSGGLPDASSKGQLRTEQDLKTGNYLDVLTNFFQLAGKDLGGDNKSFEFKSTVFGIMTRADTSLLIDYKYRKYRFERNLQFEFALHTNKDFKFSGISGGLTWAIINNRDKQRADFHGTYYETELNNYFTAVDQADSIARKPLREQQNDLLRKIRQTKLALKQEADADKKEQLEEQLDSMNSRKGEIEAERQQINPAKKEFDETGKTDKMPEQMKEAYETNQLANAQLRVDSVYKAMMAEVAVRGLLSLSINARTDSASRKFNEGNLELSYLKGMGTRRLEADIRAGLNLKDTLTPDSQYRTAIHLTAGANWIVLKNQKDDKSLLELKPNLEFRTVLSKQYPGEENFFSFNMDIRVRITDQIWIPLVVKYDLEKQNFLGFLNVSINMDAFKNALGKSK